MAPFHSHHIIRGKWLSPGEPRPHVLSKRQTSMVAALGQEPVLAEDPSLAPCSLEKPCDLSKVTLLSLAG